MAANAKGMTNGDVISLVHAKMSQDSIVMAIDNAKPAFDTSAKGLIMLNKAGVPDSVIQAVIAAGNKSAGGSSGAVGRNSANAAGDIANPENVILLDGVKPVTMHYLTPQIRSAARAWGFGGVASYAVLMGDKAVLRLKNRQPQFLWGWHR
jgi:hypothetical protein